MRSLVFVAAALGLGALFTPEKAKASTAGAVREIMGSIGGRTRAIRNNNPGNLRFYEIGWNGEIGQDDDGFSIFSSMELGVRAAYINMRTKYYRDGIRTIEKLIPSWAPAHENNVQAYVEYVSGRTGIEPGETFDFSSQAVEILTAIFRFEAGEEIAGETIINGVTLA